MVDQQGKITGKIKAVVLAGSTDFGRCPLASYLPTALWPIVDRPAILHLLYELAGQGITHATVCYDGDPMVLQDAIAEIKGMDVRFLSETLPLGTAGCLRDATKDGNDELTLVCQANIARVPNIAELLESHRQSQADMTAAMNHHNNNIHGQNEITGIYLCSRSVIAHIPKEGYCDIKETLVPSLIQGGLKVHAFRLSHNIGVFRDETGYSYAIADYLSNDFRAEQDTHLNKQNNTRVWISDTATVHDTASIYGPAVILDDAFVGPDSVVFGPTVIGKGAFVGAGCLVESSSIWDGVTIEQGCQVRQSLLDNDVTVASGSNIANRTLTNRNRSRLSRLCSGLTHKIELMAKPAMDKHRGNTTAGTNSQSYRSYQIQHRNMATALAGVVVVGLFIWSYWRTIEDLWQIWMRSDEYSCGLLVPFLAGYLIWSRRKELAKCPIKPSLLALPFFVGAQVIRFFGLYFMYSSAERLSMLLSVAALVVLLLGWQMFGKLLSIWIFLFLMLPLPRRVQGAITLPLQSWATSSAIFCLELIGYAVSRDGNIIHIGQTSVAVAEACNGLRMLTSFFVISGLVILMVKREWWEKLVILLSTLPIGLLCNTVRLTGTAMAFTVLKGEDWEVIFHDFGGFAMMPLALAIVVLELWLLKKIVYTTEVENQGSILVSNSSIQ